MKRALVIGVTGQDGAYLSRLLLEKGYEVFGGYRRSANTNYENLQYLDILDRVQMVPLEILEISNIIRVLEHCRPDEVYNLAAQSFVGISFEQPLLTSDVTALGTLRVLEAIRTVNPKIRFYQASSSEMFGMATEVPQRETTRFYPRSPYAVSKVFAHHSAVNYRESYGIFACCGILFNHESPLRGPEFVTRKITRGVASIRAGKSRFLYLGNLDARRDWGYALEYVEMMWKMLQQKEPDDYVIATGEAHTVRDFAAEAFQLVGLDWKKHVRVDRSFKRPAEVARLLGNSTKARRKLGWRARTKFRDLVKIMVEADLARAQS
jgi:GDPmannose 4,6-dehydratase